MQKKAIKYERFSKDKQSNFSIERQDLFITSWQDRNDVLVLDSFVDDGYSARTFDRPDWDRLFAFLKKYHRQIDYLLVADLSRFSREVGDAVNMVKLIQLQYSIRIVSCMRNHICDVTDPSSFQMMVLEFMQANAENLKRMSDINSGIYAAKTGIKGRSTGNERGRYIGSKSPYGYRKVGDRIKELVIDPEQAAVVQFIYNSYVKGVPPTAILQEARKMGYPYRGSSILQQLLRSPIYNGYQYVKPLKDNPGGLFPGNWEPIIDSVTWQQAQDRLNGNRFKGISLSENFPLRNVLHCVCGRKVTGAPSKGRNGYYDYYKCNHCRNTNVSARILHGNMDEILKLLSLPEYLVTAIMEESERQLATALQDNRQQLVKLQAQLRTAEANLLKLEEKFITEQVNGETYRRWHANWSQEIRYCRDKIEGLNRDENEVFALLQKNLAELTDLHYLYHSGSLIQKQSLLNLVFDSKLYVQNKGYRTGYLMDIFSHNIHILNKKQLLFIDKKTDFLKKSVEVEPGGSLSNLNALLSLIESMKVA